MKITPALAEIAGIFAADGSMQKEHICMWGNIREDREYYDKIVVPLFSKNFNISIRAHEKKSNSVYGFYICNPNTVKIFNKDLSFPIGKKTYSVEVPEKIINSKSPKLYSSFIRGFTDCDGCLNFDKRRGTYTLFKRMHHVYPRIFITSVSHKLINQIKEMLDYLKIPSSIRTGNSSKKNEKEYRVITLRGNSRLREWMRKVGFNNPVHITKYYIWKKYGFVPSNTSISERKKILKGEIDVKSYYMGL